MGFFDAFFIVELCVCAAALGACIGLLVAVPVSRPYAGIGIGVGVIYITRAWRVLPNNRRYVAKGVAARADRLMTAGWSRSRADATTATTATATATPMTVTTKQQKHLHGGRRGSTPMGYLAPASTADTPLYYGGTPSGNQLAAAALREPYEAVAAADWQLTPLAGGPSSSASLSVSPLAMQQQRQYQQQHQQQQQHVLALQQSQQQQQLYQQQQQQQYLQLMTASQSACYGASTASPRSPHHLSAAAAAASFYAAPMAASRSVSFANNSLANSFAISNIINSSESVFDASIHAPFGASGTASAEVVAAAELEYMRVTQAIAQL